MHPLARHIYLASRSSRRRELLKQIGVSFEVLLLREGPQRAADFDETPLADEAPGDYVVRVASAKAEAGWARLGQRRLMRFPVLSADTTVALEGKILSKPADREEATAFLRQLSGKAHQVHSAVAVKFDHRLEVALSTTEVMFRELDEQEIRQYVVSGEPQDKAGAYAIQGRASRWISKIEGDYNNVVGLPVDLVKRMLHEHGIS